MKTIAWDVDDVLNDLVRTWLHRTWLPAHPECKVRYEELIENPPHRLLGITRVEYVAALDAFRLSETAAAMEPVPEVLAWFTQHGHLAHHVAITATPLKTAPQSASWVLRYFGRWIRSFQVVPSFREGENLPALDRSKGEALARWRQVDVFLDDDDKNLASVPHGRTETLQIARPWNRCTTSLHDTLARLTLSIRDENVRVYCGDGFET